MENKDSGIRNPTIIEKNWLQHLFDLFR